MLTSYIAHIMFCKAKWAWQEDLLGKDKDCTHDMSADILGKMSFGRPRRGWKVCKL